MKFCPKCEARLKLDSSDSEFVCPKCGYSEKGTKIAKQVRTEGGSTINVVDEKEKREALPVIKIDRKSTRLNSSHLVISYAVFCLKKKTNTEQTQPALPKRMRSARLNAL